MSVVMVRLYAIILYLNNKPFGKSNPWHRWCCFSLPLVYENAVVTGGDSQVVPNVWVIWALNAIGLLWPLMWFTCAELCSVCPLCNISWGKQRSTEQKWCTMQDQIFPRLYSAPLLTLCWIPFRHCRAKPLVMPFQSDLHSNSASGYRILSDVKICPLAILSQPADWPQTLLWLHKYFLVWQVSGMTRIACQKVGHNSVLCT